MRRVGLVAYWYPPRQAAGALRAAALARYLPAFGWEPVVVTVRPRSSLHLPPGPLERDDVPAPALATTDRALHALAAAAVEALRGSEALETLKTENVLAGRRPHARAAHWFYRHWLSFPDDTWPWLVDRRSVARVFAARGVDAIVSTSPPPTAHLVAAAAARRLQVPWVADYRDPWSQRSAWRRAWPLAGVEARLERHTLSQAAHVVTVSAPLADNLRRLLGRPVSVVPNGFDPADRAAAVRRSASDRGRSLHAGPHRHADERIARSRAAVRRAERPRHPRRRAGRRARGVVRRPPSRGRAADGGALARAGPGHPLCGRGAARHRPRRPAAGDGARRARLPRRRLRRRRTDEGFRIPRRGGARSWPSPRTRARSRRSSPPPAAAARRPPLPRSTPRW